MKATPLLEAIGATMTAEGHRRASPPARGRARPLQRFGALAGPTVDRSLGVFTTLLVWAGQPIDLDAHLERLSESVAECYGSKLPRDLRDRVTALAATVATPSRLRITAGPNPQEGLDVDVVAVPRASPLRAPFTLVPVVLPGGLGAHKYGDRRRLDVPSGLVSPTSSSADYLLVDTDGGVLETGRGNVFMVTDGQVSTPPLDGRILPGITRRRAIDALDSIGLQVVERAIAVEELTGATEVFVTSSLDRARPVERVDGVGCWPTGRLTDWMSDRLAPGHTSAPEARPRPIGSGLRVLMLDNYDSFVYNLDQYVMELGALTEVVRNDSVTVDEVTAVAREGGIHGVVISPGPGRPEAAGVSIDLVRRLAGVVPVLGVCLGHQCIAQAFGASVIEAEVVVHGKPSIVHHDGQGVYSGFVGPILAARYHSLVVSEAALPAELVVTALTGDGVVMGVRHREHWVEGVQIHPESILTPRGHPILANFLRACDRMRS